MHSGWGKEEMKTKISDYLESNNKDNITCKNLMGSGQSCTYENS